MGREIRRVPPNWEHPKDGDDYIPLHDKVFDESLKEWVEEYELWNKGEHPDQPTKDEWEYWEWAGHPPNPEYCRPTFTEPATWYQVYETVSEGTPVTPPFETKEELVEYLVTHGDFWDQRRGDGGWDRKAAEQFVEHEWAPTMMYSPSTGLISSRDIVDLDKE